MIRRALALLLALAAPAAAQLSGPILLDQNGNILSQKPYWQFLVTGGGTVCSSTTVNGRPTNQCTTPQGAGGTLQGAYDNSAGAIPSIQLAAGKGPVDIKGPAAALGALFRVRTTGGTDIINLTDNGASVLQSQAALTLTGVAASTWSTTAGALSVSGFAGINEQVNGATYLDHGVTAANTTTLRAGITLSGAAGAGALSLGSMTGAATLPTGTLSWAGAAPATASLVSPGAFTITGGAASTWSTTSGALTLTSAAAATWSTSAGALTVDAAAALNLGTSSPSGATSIAIGKSGITTTVTGGLTQLTGAVSFTGNAASSLTTTSGALTLTGAAASTWSTTSGALTLDSAAALNLGTTNATSLAVGRSGITTTVTGGLTQLTGAVSLTGNAASSFTTSAGALTFTGAAASTWSTTAGNLTVTGGAALNLNSTGANNIVLTSAQTANTSGAVTFNTTNKYTAGVPYDFQSGGTKFIDFYDQGSTDSRIEFYRNDTGAATDAIIAQPSNIVLSFGSGGSLNIITDNGNAIGTGALRWSTVNMYTADVRTGIAYGTNAGANATVTATAAAASTAGVTWTHTGGAGGAAAGGVAAGGGGLISHTAGAGGAAAAGAGNTAAAGGANNLIGGPGGAAAGTNAGATGGTVAVTGGAGGAGAAGAAAGAGAAVTVAGGAAGSNGGGGGANGGALNLNGGGGTGTGVNGTVTLGQATTASISLNVNSSMASQTTFNLGTYTTAQLPGTCTDGAIVWDSTTTTVKRCKTNAWASLAASSEFNFGLYNAANIAAGNALSRTVVTNASTIESATLTVDIVGTSGGANFVTKLCSDGTTCGAGNIYVTCTVDCATAVGTITACTINTAAVPASTTLTWSVTTACATDPGANMNAHFTTP